MSIDRIWELMARKLSGEASAEELQELDQLLRTQPNLHFPVQTINDLWQHEATTDEAMLEAAYQQHLDRMKQQDIAIGNHEEEKQPDTIYLPTRYTRKIQRRYAWWAVAAIGIALAGWVFWSLPHRPPATGISATTTQAPVMSEIATHNGSRTNIQLPDGTHVWLNAGSKLTYDKQYGNGLREVALTGEAFFDVVKDAERPFIIHTSQIDIRVLGTAFNVKSYPGERHTETTLIRGKVEVMIKNRPDEKIILKPNEKLVVSNDEIIKTGRDNLKPQIHNEPMVTVSKLTHYTRNDSIVVETAWVQNKLVFDNESFRDLAAKMERWYNISFEFTDTRKENLRFTGVFTSETIQQALDALNINGDFHYAIKNNKVIISK